MLSGKGPLGHRNTAGASILELKCDVGSVNTWTLTLGETAAEPGAEPCVMRLTETHGRHIENRQEATTFPAGKPVRHVNLLLLILNNPDKAC